MELSIQAATAPRNYSPHRTLYIEGAQGPTEAIHMRRFKANRPCAVSVRAEAAAMVDSVDLKIERLHVEERTV